MIEMTHPHPPLSRSASALHSLGSRALHVSWSFASRDSHHPVQVCDDDLPFAYVVYRHQVSHTDELIRLSGGKRTAY